MGNLFSGWHIVILLIIVVLLFGAAKLPAMAKSVGQSMRVFKKEMKTLKEEDKPDTTTNDSAGEEPDRDDSTRTQAPENRTRHQS